MSRNSFQLIFHISNAENGVGIAFKQDGQRFDTSPRTFKLFSGINYKCTFKCKPPIKFHNLHLGGSDLELINTSPGSGEYTTVWNTTGINPTRKGSREDVLFILSGPDGNLRHKLQTKFYSPEDKHGEYGHKLGSLIWICKIDLASGTMTISNEKIL